MHSDNKEYISIMLQPLDLSSSYLCWKTKTTTTSTSYPIGEWNWWSCQEIEIENWNYNYVHDYGKKLYENPFQSCGKDQHQCEFQHRCVVYWLQIENSGNPEIVSRFWASWHDWIGREVGSWDGKSWHDLGNRDTIQQLPHQVYLKGTSHNGCSETIVARLVKIVTRFWTCVTSI